MASSPTPAPASPTASDEPAPSPQIPDHRHQHPPSSDPPPNTRRCFVCLVDEPEETLPSDWATPCSCSLEGHQECLLAWVADLEAQAKEVKCPVCKSQITVTERWDPAIQLNYFLNRRFSKWSPRILLGFLASGALVSSSFYGVKAIDWFAGPDATMAFMFKSEDLEVPLGQFVRRQNFPRNEQSSAVNLLHIGFLPLIAPALILNRLSIGEVVILPASLIYATLFDQTTEFLNWPPAPERVVALYPVLRASYFHLHKAISMRLERMWVSWSLEGDGEHHGFAHDQVHPQEPEAGNFLDFEIDIQIGGDEQGMAGDDAPQNRAVDGNGRSPVNFIAGALLWPGVCYGAGELLRALLPSRLVSRPASGPNTGLLQERWGRSLIGGCLFVVLKDMFFLYVKYRKAMNRPYRKIKNSDRRNLRG